MSEVEIAIKDNALSTFDNLRDYASLTDVSKFNRFKRLLNTSSSMLQQYINRNLARASAVEYYKYTGLPRLVTVRSPINSVARIVQTYAFGSEDGTPVDATYFGVENATAGIIYFAAPLPWNGFRNSGITQDRKQGFEKPSLLVEYDAGFVTPQQSITTGGPYFGVTPTLPDEIELACLDYAIWLDKMQGQFGEVSSEKIGDAEVRYRPYGRSPNRTNDGIPDFIAARMAHHKRVPQG